MKVIVGTANMGNLWVGDKEIDGRVKDDRVVLWNNNFGKSNADKSLVLSRKQALEVAFAIMETVRSQIEVGS